MSTPEFTISLLSNITLSIFLLKIASTILNILLISGIPTNSLTLSSVIFFSES